MRYKCVFTNYNNADSDWAYPRERIVVPYPLLYCWRFLAHKILLQKYFVESVKTRKPIDRQKISIFCIEIGKWMKTFHKIVVRIL